MVWEKYEVMVRSVRRQIVGNLQVGTTGIILKAVDAGIALLIEGIENEMIGVAVHAIQ